MNISLSAKLDKDHIEPVFLLSFTPLHIRNALLNSVTVDLLMNKVLMFTLVSFLFHLSKLVLVAYLPAYICSNRK